MAWSSFWDKLQEEVENNPGSRLHMCYLQHNLQQPATSGIAMRPSLSRFQRLFSEGSDHVGEEEFATYAGNRYLADVIDWGMRVGWTGWSDHSSLRDLQYPVRAGE